MLEAKIVNTGRGPEIVGTRITVYDVISTRSHAGAWERGCAAVGNTQRSPVVVPCSSRRGSAMAIGRGSVEDGIPTRERGNEVVRLWLIHRASPWGLHSPWVFSRCQNPLAHPRGTGFQPVSKEPTGKMPVPLSCRAPLAITAPSGVDSWRCGSRSPGRGRVVGRRKSVPRGGSSRRRLVWRRSGA